ncbi:MAG: hypothetical protein JST62_00845, partial [Bacteroidetes bacterium]|nr:hypothetical protein [Bacteroidota bacterium]
MKTIEISNENLIKLKKLIEELETFQKIDENGNAEPWDLDDLYSNL